MNNIKDFEDLISHLTALNIELQNNQSQLKSIGDFAKIVEDLKGFKSLNNDVLKKHIESIDWQGIADQSIYTAQEQFLKANNKLLESIKSFENAQIKATQAVSLVDMKVLHETANQTQKILKQQSQIKTKNVFFVMLGSLIFMFFVFGYGLQHFGLLLKKNQKELLKFADDTGVSAQKMENNKYYLYVPSSLQLHQYQTDNPNWQILEVQK